MTRDRLAIIAVITIIACLWFWSYPAKAGPIELEGGGAYHWQITHHRGPVDWDDQSWEGGNVFVKNHLDDCLYGLYDRWSVEVREYPIKITHPTSGRCEIDYFVFLRHEVDNPPTHYPPDYSYYTVDAWLIPEPSPLALVGLGLAALALRRKG